MNRKTNETLTSVSMHVPLVQGCAQFWYPHGLKTTIFETFCIVQGVECLNNFETTYYLTCNVSYFPEKDQMYKHNILQAFTSQPKGMMQMSNKIISVFNSSPDEIKIYARKYINQQLVIDTTFNANLVLELYGFRV